MDDPKILDLTRTFPGRTYWVAHAIQKPNKELIEFAKRAPKLFDDPAYCPRLIATLAKEQGLKPEDIGKPVIVALVRVDQDDEPESQLPATASSRADPVYVVRRPGPKFSIEYGDHKSHIEKRELDGTRRVQLPEDWRGTLDEARAYFESHCGQG